MGLNAILLFLFMGVTITLASDTAVDCPLKESLTNGYTLSCIFSEDTIATINIFSTITDDDIVENNRYWDVTNCNDVCVWDLSVFICDDNNRLTEILINAFQYEYIFWSRPSLPMNYNWPSQLTSLTLYGTGFKGNFNFSNLSPQLEYLSIRSESLLTGTVYWADLPRTLTYLTFADTDFEGSVPFAELPNTLTYLNIKFTSFSGTLDWNHVPPNIEYLDVRHNVQLNGTVNLQSLPSTLTYLDLSGNAFQGTVNFTNLHKRMPNITRVLLGYNRFNGTVDWSGFSPLDFELSLNENNFSGSVNISAMNPVNVQTYLHLSNNDFSGTVDIENLPYKFELYLDADVVCNADVFCEPNQISTTRSSSYCGDYSSYHNPACVDTCRCVDASPSLSPTPVPTLNPTDSPTMPTYATTYNPAVSPCTVPSNITTAVPSYQPTVPVNVQSNAAVRRDCFLFCVVWAFYLI